MKAYMHMLSCMGIVRGVTKDTIGLGVRITPTTYDLAKPASSATRIALDLRSGKGSAYTKADVDQRISNRIARPLRL